MADQLSGRDLDLDVAVAERVMGWKRQPDYNYWMTFQGGTFQLHKLIATWHPSESIEAAMQVVDEMAERGFDVEIDQLHRSRRYVVFKNTHAPTERTFASALPEAICRAALKAVEGNKSGKQDSL